MKNSISVRLEYIRYWKKIKRETAILTKNETKKEIWTVELNSNLLFQRNNDVLLCRLI